MTGAIVIIREGQEKNNQVFEKCEGSYLGEAGRRNFIAEEGQIKGTIVVYLQTIFLDHFFYLKNSDEEGSAIFLVTRSNCDQKVYHWIFLCAGERDYYVFL